MFRPSQSCGIVARQRGVTLIELLLAIAIGALVVAVLYTIYATVTQTAVSQKERRRRADPVTRTLEQIHDDLAGTFLVPEDETCEVRLAPHEVVSQEFDRLDLCAALRPVDTTDAAWMTVYHVTYRVEERPGGYALLRESFPLAGPGRTRPETNLMLSAVARFKVELFDGAAWLPVWPGEDTEVRPRAARIELDAELLDTPLQTEVLIPAGRVIRPTMKQESEEP